MSLKIHSQNIFKELVVKSELSHREFRKQVCLDQGSFSKYFNGKVSIGYDTYVCYAGKLNIEVQIELKNKK
jgi:hypothetical protein